MDTPQDPRVEYRGSARSLGPGGSPQDDRAVTDASCLICDAEAVRTVAVTGDVFGDRVVLCATCERLVRESAESELARRVTDLDGLGSTALAARLIAALDRRNP